MRTLLVMVVALAAAAPPPIEHDYAEVNGVRLRQEFGRDHLAVAPDMRGYNLSSKPEGVEQYRMPLLVEDVRALAAKLGHGTDRKFILVGHDWGGVVAWAYAAAHPETIEKLVIVNAPHPAVFGRELRENPAQQKASTYMLMFRGPDAEKTLSANDHQMLVQIVLGNGLKTGQFTEADKAEYLKAWSQPGALTGGLNYYRASQVGPPAGGTGPVDRLTGHSSEMHRRRSTYWADAIAVHQAGYPVVALMGSTISRHQTDLLAE